MYKYLSIIINLVLLCVLAYSYLLISSNKKDISFLKQNIIQTTDISKVLGRLQQTDKSLLNKLPMTEIKKGSISLNAKTNPEIVEPNGCESNRGLYGHTVVFDKEFSGVPEVSFGLIGLDFRNGPDHRIKIEVTEVSKLGFTVNFVAWCDTEVSFAEANWIAFYSF